MYDKRKENLCDLGVYVYMYISHAIYTYNHGHVNQLFRHIASSISFLSKRTHTHTHTHTHQMIYYTLVNSFS